MSSSKENKSRLQAEGSDNLSLPEDLDKQLRLTSEELVQDIVLFTTELIDERAVQPGPSVEEQKEGRLLLIQELFFHCLLYARNYSLVLKPAYSQKLEQRLLDLLSLSFCKEFFPGNRQQETTEYFKKVFTNEYLAFVRKMEAGGVATAGPNEFFPRCIDEIMKSAAMIKLSEISPGYDMRRLISQFLEKQAFLKISRIFLSF